MKNNTSYRFLAGFILGAFALLALAWTPTERSFNVNQFGTNGYGISIKGTVPLTNAYLWLSTSLAPDGSADWTLTRVGNNISLSDSLSLFSYLFKNDGTFVSYMGTFTAGITNLATTDAIIYADANGKYRETGMTWTGDSINGNGNNITNIGTLTTTNLLEEIETVHYATGSNLILNFQYGGGRLVLTNNACVTNINGLSSNQWFHNYRLLTLHDANGTWSLFWHTNLASFQGGTNGIFPLATNAGAMNSFYLETSYWGTNVNVGQGVDWRKL